MPARAPRPPPPWPPGGPLPAWRRAAVKRACWAKLPGARAKGSPGARAKGSPGARAKVSPSRRVEATALGEATARRWTCGLQDLAGRSCDLAPLPPRAASAGTQRCHSRHHVRVRPRSVTVFERPFVRAFERPATYEERRRACPRPQGAVSWAWRPGAWCSVGLDSCAQNRLDFCCAGRAEGENGTAEEGARGRGRARAGTLNCPRKRRELSKKGFSLDFSLSLLLYRTRCPASYKPMCWRHRLHGTQRGRCAPRRPAP